MPIVRMIIDKAATELVLEYASDGDALSRLQLTFEYLRVCLLQPEVKGKGQRPLLPANKKHIQLLRIEPVAKHGFRFCFDDGHQQIFSERELLAFHQQFDVRWAEYLQQLHNSGLSREATIDIKQL